MPEQDPKDIGSSARKRAFDAWNSDDAPVAAPRAFGSGASTSAPLAPSPAMSAPGAAMPHFGMPDVGVPLVAAAIGVPNASSNPAAVSNAAAPSRGFPSASALEESILQGALAPLLAVVGAFLVVMALGEVIWQIRAPEFGNVQWRFVATGVLAPNLMTLAIGSVMITTGVMRAARPIWGRIWMGLSVLAAVILLMTLPLYLLDTLQIRPLLPPNMTGRFLIIAVVKNVLAYGGAAVVCLMCMFTTRRALRVERERATETLRAWSA